MKHCLTWQWLHEVLAPGYSLWDQLGKLCKKHNNRVGPWRLAWRWKKVTIAHFQKRWKRRTSTDAVTMFIPPFVEQKQTLTGLPAVSHGLPISQPWARTLSHRLPANHWTFARNKARSCLWHVSFWLPNRWKGYCANLNVFPCRFGSRTQGWLCPIPIMVDLSLASTILHEIIHELIWELINLITFDLCWETWTLLAQG